MNHSFVRRFSFALYCALMCWQSLGHAKEFSLDQLVVPPGNFAQLDSHRIYYRCLGSGFPTVVVDSGIGGAAIEWTPIQELVAKFTRICTYDRAGYGWSDPGPGPRVTSRIVEELRRTLTEAREYGPFIFVGHSFGGFTGRYFAAHYPEQIVGMVLIESSHPDGLLGVVAGPGRPRHAINESRIARGRADISPYISAASFLNSRRKAIFAQMDELSHFSTSAAEIATLSLVGNPLLTVIARAENTDDVAREADWQRLQFSLLELSEDSRLIHSVSSDHDIHLVEPQIVVEQIRLVVDNVRASRQTKQVN